MSDAALAELESLIEAERAALLAADFEALAPLVARKEALFARLPETASIAPRRLRDLKSAAERNHALLAATGRALKGVSRRLAEIRTANGPLNTYSQTGERHTLGQDRCALERRA